MHNAYLEGATVLALAGLSLVLLDPFHIWMPDMAYMIVLCCLVAAFGAFAAFVLCERAGDEREDAHRMLSGRMAFLAGSGVLVAGIVLQGLTGPIDPWLIYALCAMVFAKLAARAYSDRLG
ncbi:MAG: hypothetical protein AB199_01615 [Parcubacteria bacterium C7867-004]|nr:MAG: hypothetical protein AB199_01615 [Parcubacteria bacterium C7867-004]